MPESLKCLNCGGDLKFNPTLQKWKCEWCDSEYTEQDLKGFTPEADEALSDGAPSDRTSPDGVAPDHGKRMETGPEDIVSYKCGYCGAEVATTEETAATFCVYCQRPITILSQVSGEFKPSLILPFKNTKEQALEQFKNFLQNKRFLPDDYREDQNVEKLTGVYIPFWFYDGEVHFNVSGEADVVMTTRMGDWQIIKTDTYGFNRVGAVRVEEVPVDASAKTPDDIMKAVEPYNLAEMKKFATPYLSGFFAERYTVSKNDAFKNIEEWVLGSADGPINSTLANYQGVRRQKNQKKIQNLKATYGLLPVWMLYSFYDDKEHLFLMNGQTGKILGDLPMDKRKISGFRLMTFLIGGLISALIALAVVLILPQVY